MTALRQNRHLARLTAAEVTARLTEQSILCLPVGAMEQHGPHLPLDTDTVIAERFSTLLAGRYGEQHDLWVLPPLPYGLSHEHTWSPGTVSLDIADFTGYLTRIVQGHTMSTPARRLLVVNRHGGNRGVLATLLHQLERDCRIKCCAVHPSALARIPNPTDQPEIHAGVRETSLMLALAPQEVDLGRLPEGGAAPSVDHVRTRTLDRGATWPWTSDAPELAADGVIGHDPRSASAEFGEALLAAALEAAGEVLSAFAAQLVEDPCG